MSRRMYEKNRVKDINKIMNINKLNFFQNCFIFCKFLIDFIIIK